MDEQIFRNCGSCKKSIKLGGLYYECSISTCKKTSYCSMPCFDEHSPIFRHKNAWALERKAPLVYQSEDAMNKTVTKRIAPSLSITEAPRDILIVGSKLKDYIRHKAGYNTSQAVLDRLSDMVRILSDRAIEKARRENRKTVMDRDFSF